MKALPIAASAALLLTTGPAMPQSVAPPAIANLRCSDIAKADPAYQAALIYYAAGYRDGVDYTMALNSTAANQASSAISAMASTPIASTPASSSDLASMAETSNAGSSTASSAQSSNSTSTLGGLTLQAQDVIAACKSAPDALLTDIIANRGGGTGFKGTPGGVQPAAGGANGTTLPGTGGTAPATGAAPASGAASASGAGGIVSSVIQGVSQQVQQGVTSTAPPAGASAPAGAASSP